MQPQTEQHRVKRACTLTARGLMHGRARGRSTYGFSRMSEALDHTPDSSALWPQYTSLKRGANSSVSGSVERRQVQNSPQRCEGTRTQQNMTCFAPACQTGTHECSQTSWLAVFAFAGAGQKKKTLQNPRHPHSQVCYRRYSRRMPIRIQYAAHVPVERRRSHFQAYLTMRVGSISQRGAGDRRRHPQDTTNVRPIQMEVSSKICFQTTPGAP